MPRNNMFYWQSDRPFTAKEIKEIFLDRKNDYSKELLMKAAFFATKESITCLLDPINFGSVNIVCPFATSTGANYIIRAHPKQVRNEYFHVESLAMKAASQEGVPVPNTILIDDSREIVPFDYMVTTKVRGDVMQSVLEQNMDNKNTYLRQIGRYLGMLHKIKANKFGFFDNDLAKKGLLVGILDTNTDHYLSALDADESFYEQNTGWLDNVTVRSAIYILRSNAKYTVCTNPTLIHNDIADWNTVVNGDQVTGILDWDECFSGDPVFEFATMSLFYSDSEMSQIISGYCETNSLPADYNEKIDLYTLRYIINKSKISIKKLQFVEKESTRTRFNQSKEKLKLLVDKLK